MLCTLPIVITLCYSKFICFVYNFVPIDIKQFDYKQETTELNWYLIKVFTGWLLQNIYIMQACDVILARVSA